MRIGLTDKERDLFSSIETLNKLISEQRFEFTNRKLQEMNLSGIELIDTDVINVEINNSKMKNSKFHKADFRGVDFIDVDFSNSSINSTVFDHCTFTRTKHKEVTIENSNFKNCKFNKSEFDNDKLKNVVFENSDMNEVDYYDTVISKASFNSINMNDVDFLGGEIDALELNKNTMDSCGFMKLRAKEIIISDSTIKQSSLANLDVTNEIRLSNCNGIGFTIRETKVPKISILKVGEFEDIHLSSVEVEDLLFDNNKIHGVTFGLSKFKSMIIKDSDISLFDIDDSEVFEKGLFSNTKFDVFILIQDKIRNLTVDNCIIGNMLSLKNTSFENLDIKNVTVLPKTEYIEQDVTYDNNVRFKQ